MIDKRYGERAMREVRDGRIMVARGGYLNGCRYDGITFWVKAANTGNYYLVARICFECDGWYLTRDGSLMRPAVLDANRDLRTAMRNARRKARVVAREESRRKEG